MKILQKIDIYIYILFLLLIMFLCTPVFAYENTDTSYNLTMQDYDSQLRSVDCGSNGTMYNVINDIIDNFDDTYYNLFIGQPMSNGNSIVLYISRNNAPYNLYLYNGTTTNILTSSLYFSTSQFRFPLYVMTNLVCSNYQERSDYQRFVNVYTNNLSSSSDLNNFYWDNYNAPNRSSTDNTNDNYENFTSLNNNDSFNTSLWFYYSSQQLKYSYYTNNSYYGKNLCITDNDTCYVKNDLIPSYYDLHHNDTPDTPSFIGYKTSLDTFYTSIPVNNVNNYQLKFSFKVPQSLLGAYQTTSEYIDNTRFNYVCSGRVDNTNYYSYETFPCSLTSSYTSTESSIEYTFNNFTTSSSLTNYDKIYITIDSSYIDDNINKIIFDLSYNYSLGDIFNTSYKGAIYEKFTNLPLNFRVYLSSNNSLNNSSLYVRKFNFINYNIKYNGFSNTNQQQNLVIGNSILGNINGESVDFISTQVSNNIDTGIMIYQQNSAIFLPSLELFFNSGIVVSFNNNSNSDTFYYIDSNGDIQSDNYIKPDYNDSSNDYDISYYINKVSSFIDELSNDCIEFSNYTQFFYNGFPLVFQTFIFVLFILACVYFTYLLIKK